MTPIGIRHNNPLNIRRGKTTWKGETPSDSPSKGSREGAFCKFISLEWGIRAAFCLLRTYATKYHLNCIADIIMRWAPPSENNTAQYIRNVCSWTGFGGMQQLTESDWPALVKAMARQETGICLSKEQLEKGFEMFKEIQN